MREGGRVEEEHVKRDVWREEEESEGKGKREKAVTRSAEVEHPRPTLPQVASNSYRRTHIRRTHIRR